MAKKDNKQRGFGFGDFELFAAESAGITQDVQIETKPAITTWHEAENAVREFAAQCGVTKVYWGTGATIHEPHAVASTLDALSGEGSGYFVRVYPQGGNSCYLRDGKDKPCHMTTIRLGK